jgi:hypothetical protein
MLRAVGGAHARKAAKEDDALELPERLPEAVQRLRDALD